MRAFVKKKFDTSNEAVTFRCPKELLDRLKSTVISIIRQEGKMYYLSDLIRDTLEHVYPPHKQYKLFGDEHVEKDKARAAAAKQKGDGEKSSSSSDIVDRREE